MCLFDPSHFFISCNKLNVIVKVPKLFLEWIDKPLVCIPLKLNVFDAVRLIFQSKNWPSLATHTCVKVLNIWIDDYFHCSSYCNKIVCFIWSFDLVCLVSSSLMPSDFGKSHRFIFIVILSLNGQTTELSIRSCVGFSSLQICLRCLCKVFCWCAVAANIDDVFLLFVLFCAGALKFRIIWIKKLFTLFVAKNRLNRFDVFAKTCLTKCVSVAPRMCVDELMIIFIAVLRPSKKDTRSPYPPASFFSAASLFYYFLWAKTNRRHL